MNFDICIIGSGAGASPIAFTLSKAGAKVLVLEKGPWLTEQHFTKDELACCRRSTYTPNLADEKHVIEDTDSDGQWVSESTEDSGWDFWNGNVVGGSSNFMSGYFHRLKPIDFRLKSEFGDIEGANVVDWPISYDDLAPYYDLVDRQVGVSGKVINHKHQEPRSSDFPFKPVQEHPIASWIDKAAQDINYQVFPVPRAILSEPAMGRKSCEYSGYCGSYGCFSGAKGSGRAALLNHAVATGNCTIKPESQVTHIASDNLGKITHVNYIDSQGRAQQVSAKI
jgi:choline dehydrogenase-like flavoprotein